MAFPILQFGTSRFLLAHADLFVSEAMARGEALGQIAVVQTTGSAQSAARVAALADGGGYPVRIRGLAGGVTVDDERRGIAVGRALRADRDWAEVRRLAIDDAQVILSNTGESGYDLDAGDDAALIDAPGRVPRSFPAKLAVLLHARWRQAPDRPLSVIPCELASRNGDRLRGIVAGLAVDWRLPEAYLAYLQENVRWANTLVDRIVSEPIHPVGAVAEPYALWAIERQAGLILPCSHPAIVLTDDLDRYERLKLHILNLGHTILAERWLAEGSPDGRIVLDAMNDPAARAALDQVWSDEVLPVFAATGDGPEARDYVATIVERFRNPYLKHRLSDIAQNHAEKKRRRLGPMVAAAERLGLSIGQRVLREALQSGR